MILVKTYCGAFTHTFAAPYTLIDTQFHKRLMILNYLETTKTLRQVSDKYFKNFCIGWATSHRTVLCQATRRAHADRSTLVW
jgi:hypothetical protein